MSGEGLIANVGAIRERIERHLAEVRGSSPTAPLLEAGPAFDKRPGELDAARGAACGIVVAGHRPDDREWQVLAIVTGEDGTFCQVALEPHRAEALAEELQSMAAIVREGRAMVAQKRREREGCK